MRWSTARADALRIPASVLPELVDSSGLLGPAGALPGAPPLAGLAGDQQASLLGLGCVRPGDTKITFGTSAMLDTLVGDAPAYPGDLGDRGTFPIVAWRLSGETSFALEASELCAGGCIEWLRELGVLGSAGESGELAARCEDTGGVAFVPALVGLGTPFWDYGARGAFLGLTRGTGRPEIARAVLEGVACRTADLIEAVEGDAGRAIPTLRVDGGMTDNETFLQVVADATGRRVEVSPEREATALGAAFLAGRAVGLWPDAEAVARTWQPRVELEPRGRPDRARWHEALARARGSGGSAC